MKLFNFPIFVFNNAPNCLAINLIYFGKFLTSSIGIGLSYFFHLLPCQSSHWMSFSIGILLGTSHKTRTSLIPTISLIVFIVSKKKMIRSYALRIITPMKNPQPIRYCSIMENPRIAMRRHDIPVFIRSLYRKIRISFRRICFPVSEIPTFLRLSNIPPKPALAISFSARLYSWIGIGTLPSTKFGFYPGGIKYATAI